MDVDVIETLSAYLYEIKYENLPQELVVETKKQILDTLGATIGGSTCSIAGEINQLVDLIREWGGKEESTIIGFGGRVPAPNAALVNGLLSTRLDFDDTHLMYLSNHASRAIVPTAFAMAERQNNINGKELITSVALGHDLECRLKLAVEFNIESQFGFITNFFGAAATAGLLLGLNKENLKYALGLAFHQISGASTVGHTPGSGASVKGLNNGNAAKTGIISALLAERGFSPNTDFLEPQCKRNIYQLFYHGFCTPGLSTLDLGKRFMGLNTSQKGFPCCHGQHTAITAALDLVKEHNLKSEDMANIILRLSPSDYNLLGQPVGKKQNPQNMVEAQFSICWGIASAIIYGKVDINNFTDRALGDKRIRELALKIFPEAELDLAGSLGLAKSGLAPTIVDIVTNNGTAYSKQVENPFGTPQNPMSLDDVAIKFKHCCQFSAKPIPEKKQDQVIEMVNKLEKIDNVSQVVRLLG